MCYKDSFAIDFNDRSNFLSPDKPLIHPPRVDAYLAGPLTNNDAGTVDECAVVRRAVKHVLHGYDFLNVVFNVYDPADHTPPESSHTPEEVYAIDHKCTICSDLVIFHINAPSLGVGIEAQLSAMATTPRLVIRKRSVATSRMFAGMFSSTIAEIEYDDPSDVARRLRELLPDICPRVIESVERRRPHLDEVKKQRVGEKYLMQRIRHRITISQVEKETDIPECWLRQIEQCPEFASTMSVMVMRRISTALKCCTHYLDDGTINVKDHSGELLPHQTESLRNLARFSNGQSSVTDERVFNLWSRNMAAAEQQREEAAAFRQGANNANAISVEEWRQLYNDMELFD